VERGGAECELENQNKFQQGKTDAFLHGLLIFPNSTFQKTSRGTQKELLSTHYISQQAMGSKEMESFAARFEGLRDRIQRLGQVLGLSAATTDCCE
jgi:hypothetical protein